MNNDPLDEALKPPPDESPEERESRLSREEEARQVSLAIDASLKAERQARRKKRIVRLLLLGQSESGLNVLSELERGLQLKLTRSREINHPSSSVFVVLLMFA